MAVRGSRRQARHAPVHARRAEDGGDVRTSGAEDVGPSRLIYTLSEQQTGDRAPRRFPLPAAWIAAGARPAAPVEPADAVAGLMGAAGGGADPTASGYGGPGYSVPHPLGHEDDEGFPGEGGASGFFEQGQDPTWPGPTQAGWPGPTQAGWPDGTTGPEGTEPLQSGRAVLRGVAKRARSLVVGGAELRLLVLASTAEDTTAVDLASGAIVRLRIPWPDGHEPDLSPFDVVEATLADDPERDDLAQPEAATASTLPRHVGTLRGRRARRLLTRLAVAPHGPLLGFLGPSAPYWEFRGFRPSVALIRPARGPQLIRRPGDGSTWVRFGLQRDDVWLPVEDPRTCRALDASRRERLNGKALTTALGYAPYYLLVAVSRPRDGHCYKICAGILPKD